MASLSPGFQGLDVNVLTPGDYHAIQAQIEEHARTRPPGMPDFACLANDNTYRRVIIQHYINARKEINARRDLTADTQTGRFGATKAYGPGGECGFDQQRPPQIRWESGGAGRVEEEPTEGALRDTLAEKYGVVMSQFQTNFRDKTIESLKTETPANRKKIYNNKIGCLGMKTIHRKIEPSAALFEAMFLYVIDDIEDKQRNGGTRAGVNFLERVGMDKDVSSYYRGHRKSNHGGASSALYSFNEAESFSFRRDCMKAGLLTDVAAMEEAETRNAKNHPYQRTFYSSKQKDPAR